MLMIRSNKANDYSHRLLGLVGHLWGADLHIHYTLIVKLIISKLGNKASLAIVTVKTSRARSDRTLEL